MFETKVSLPRRGCKLQQRKFSKMFFFDKKSGTHRVLQMVPRTFDLIVL